MLSPPSKVNIVFTKSLSENTEMRCGEALDIKIAARRWHSDYRFDLVH